MFEEHTISLQTGGFFMYVVDIVDMVDIFKYAYLQTL